MFRLKSGVESHMILLCPLPLNWQRVILEELLQKLQLLQQFLFCFASFFNAADRVKK
jgi:hypothetical protein